MPKVKFSLETMYGDHHVLEVRRLLLDLPGVEDVYASSCFQIVEVEYDPAKVDEKAIKGALETAGYLGELQPPEETGVPTYGIDGANQFLRHTVTFQQTSKSIGFTQAVSNGGRPLWPCPGMGVVKNVKEGESNG